MVTARIAGSGWATPPDRSQTELWERFFAAHYDNRRVARRAFRRSGVRTRHGVADPVVEDVSAWSTEARMRRFVTEALPLGKAALAECLADAGIDPADVAHLTVVSCTGYTTPGLDILLARDLGMSDAVQRLHVGHMGCYAAVPGLAAVSDTVVARGGVAVLLCLELTSLHIQPACDDVEQIVAHALFSDAAAAVALTPDPAPAGASDAEWAGGRRARSGRRRAGLQLEVVDVVARTDAAHAQLMTWDVTDLGFRMRLSPRVPLVLREHVTGAVDELLGRHGIDRGAVAGWAIHPGGPRIVDVVADRLALNPGQVEDSLAVLRDHGNCSSGTLLLILDRMRRTGALHNGAPVVAMAFGPGLTLYAALLRARV